MPTSTDQPPDHREHQAGAHAQTRTPLSARQRGEGPGEGFVFPIIQRWQAFTRSQLGARLLPLYAALLGAALGALVADRFVRSMWHHAIFTGTNQWRTVALILVVFWIAIGAVAALAVLGPPDEQQSRITSDGTDGATAEPAAPAPHSSTPS
jgi:hypothetical protein